MRFMRLCAAIAALSCSALAGQAQAATILNISGTLTPGSAGDSYFSAALFSPAVNSATKLRTHLTLSGAASGFFSFYADGNYYVTDAHGNLYDANNMDFSGNGSFASARTASFDAELPRIYGMQTSFWWVKMQPTVYLGLTGMTKPLDYTLTVKSFGVPEPSTWALMIVGFGAVGAALRQRRKNSYCSDLCGEVMS